MNIATLKHRIDGRIRVKVDQLKGNRNEVNRISLLLQQLDGVVDFKANDITGSLVINYDENVINADLLLGYLHKNKVFETVELKDQEISTKISNSSDVNISTNEIVKTVLHKVIEIVAERAIVALL